MSTRSYNKQMGRTQDVQRHNFDGSVGHQLQQCSRHRSPTAALLTAIAAATVALLTCCAAAAPGTPRDLHHQPHHHRLLLDQALPSIHNHLPHNQQQQQQEEVLLRKLQQQQPVSSSSSSSQFADGPIPTLQRRCGSESPPDELLTAVLQRLAAQRRRKSETATAAAADGSITVPVAFTVVEPEEQDADLKDRYYGPTTAAQLAALLVPLNAAFSGQLAPPAGGSNGSDTPLRYKLCFTQTVRNTSWYTSPPVNSTHLNIDGEARKEWRVGGRGTLNVFIKPLNVFSGMSAQGDAAWTFGAATFPHFLEFPPFPAYSADADGVVIDGSVIPGATGPQGTSSFTDGRSSSMTLAHQVAHWLSGLHTFQSTDVISSSPSTCSAPTPPAPWPPEAAGDFCTDTPVHAAPSSAGDTGCAAGAAGDGAGAPAARDSCSNYPGTDPVFNILNHVDEECMLGFTKCQRDIFEDAWSVWRAPAAAGSPADAASLSSIAGQPPTATDDAYRFQVLPPGTNTHSTVAPSFVLDIFKNDVSNIPGHVLTISDLQWAVVAPPVQGQLSLSDDGTALVYTPNKPGSLTDSFSYRAFDCNGASAPATVTVIVVEEGCPADAATLPPCVDSRTGLLLAENVTCAQNTTSTFCITSFTGARWCRYRYRPAFVECRPTGAQCDAPERCSGIGPTCPPDVFDSSCMAAICAASSPPDCVDGAAGILVRGDAPCTTNSTNYCGNVTKNGNTFTCSYQYKPATSVCRPSTDDCDMADKCVPGQPSCPADKRVPNCPLPVCPTSGLPECLQPSPVVLVQSCVSGTNQYCIPVPNSDPTLFCRYGYKSSVCRPAKDACDIAESCTAGNSVCPADALKPNCDTGFKCPTASLGTCVNATSGLVVASCTNGPSSLCKIILSGSSRYTCRYALLPSSTACRAAKDECDLPELCQAGDSNCGADLKKPGCVLPSNNTETLACPAEGLPDCVNGTSGKGASICFTSSTAFCLRVPRTNGNFTCSYTYKPATTACRPAVNECDIPEFCRFAAECPVDRARPSCVAAGTTCPTDGLPPCVEATNGVFVSAGGSCLSTKKAYCQNVTGLPGTSGIQFCRYGYKSNAAVCRPAAGPCDKPELCHEGGVISAACGPDRFLTNTKCRPIASACDAAEVCSGASADCPPDIVAPPNKIICRQSYDPCDVPEVCNGVDRTCPADRLRTDKRACSLEPYGVFLRTAIHAKLVNATLSGGPASFTLGNGTVLSPPPAGLHRCGACKRGVCDLSRQLWCW